MSDRVRVCKVCNQEKPIESFHTTGVGVYPDGERYRYHTCRACYIKKKKGNPEWSDNRAATMRNSGRKRGAELRLQIIEAYGGKCACCGEDNEKFLTIDHVNNDGYMRKKIYGSARRGVQYYREIVAAGYPSDLQILCYNCNCGRARNGGVCPHQE